MSDRTVRDLIVDDNIKGRFRIDRRVFTDPAVLEQERREVFDRCWLYAGHESEVRNPRDFLSRQVGGRAVILMRDETGQVGVYLNSCPHRGNTVCRERRGNGRAFICFYHGWTFNLRGELVGVPGEEAYGPDFDRAELGLSKPPRMEIYRGMVFVSFDQGIVDLVTYLGNAKEYLDLMLDYSGEDVEIAPGAQSYSMKANWKLLVENSIDAYHGLHTHKRFFVDFLRDIGIDNSAWQALSGKAAVKEAPMDLGRGLSLGNGHALTENAVGGLPFASHVLPHLARIREKLVEKFGEERAHRIADFSRNLLIFPNLILVANWRTVRTFYPVAPDYVEIDSWALLPRGEPPELRQGRLENFISFLGPAGFGTPDDVEGLEGCQRGFANAHEQGWSDVSRGMLRPDPNGSDELQMRAFWRRWHALMCGDRHRTDFSDRPPLQTAAE